MKVPTAVSLVLTVILLLEGTRSANVLKVQRNKRWVNKYDQPLNFKCPKHQSISMIISTHNNKHEDRLWDFSCKNTFSRPSSCSWIGYVNDFDKQFTFTCPFGSVLSGMQSYHDSKKEDRRWKYLCCSGEVAVAANCKWSGYVNNFDAYLRWDAPQNNFLVGASSYHDNDKEDRRWKFQYCKKR